MKYSFRLGCYKNNSCIVFVSQDVFSLSEAWLSVSDKMAKFYHVKKVYPSQVLVKSFLGWARLSPLLSSKSF